MSAFQWIVLGIFGLAICTSCWWLGYQAGRVQGVMDVHDTLECSRTEPRA